VVEKQHVRAGRQKTSAAEQKNAWTFVGQSGQPITFDEWDEANPGGKMRLAALLRGWSDDITGGRSGYAGGVGETGPMGPAIPVVVATSCKR
jgi:hypothetical protein